MKMPNTILCIILTAVSLTSANAAIPNQSGLKIDLNGDNNVDIDDCNIVLL